MIDPYIEAQFNKLTDNLEVYSIQLRDNQGYRTLWLNITPIQLKTIKDILNVKEQ